MTASDSESNPPLNPVTGGVIAGLSLLTFLFFVATGQPLGLAIGATLALLVIATIALFVIERDEIVALPYDSTVPESRQPARTAGAQLPSKLAPMCSNCNTELAPTNKFCPECGHKLTAADFAPPSA